VVPPTVSAPSTTSLQSVAEQTWAQIRNYTFEQRAPFITNFRLLEARLEAAILEIKSKRIGFKGDPNVWDSEMKRLDDANAYLKSMFTELTQATSANWDDRKEKVIVAWERMQDAYDRAKNLEPR
jgi:hypothetical protein